MQHDLLNDALVKLRHADQRGQLTATLHPVSTLVGNVLGLLREQGYIGEFSFQPDGKGGSYTVALNRRINSCGVVKPRIAIAARDLERYEARFLPAQDFGMLVLSTNKGIMSHVKARELGVGGKVLAYVY